ncbi:G-type lectin S-receptor-like serine/threonine-protein kinase At1g11410 [Juglans regia]|uniref:G-type lectin S-receptor-like serine/threonine-protein kinase At1g11410 n=1 Tax=Juglans regia TaxID=51240 RepID=A0A6P9EBA0_JUGRE|nr:G-type lectin S-receptor-like serine/threonine-protein kinase At1g11410 [Juglans regia]
MVLWQSFDYPTNTLVPNMKVGLDRRTGLNRVLTSWKSKDDPGTGNWLYKIDSNGAPQFFLYKGKVPWGRNGHWSGDGWGGVQGLQRSTIINISFVDNENEITAIYHVFDPTQLSAIVLNESGLLDWLCIGRETVNGFCLNRLYLQTCVTHTKSVVLVGNARSLVMGSSFGAKGLQTRK